MLTPFTLNNRSNSDSEDDIEPDTVDQEYPSLDSVPSDNSLPGPTKFSPRNSEPPSLTESMQLMDEILSDKTMDRIERIDKLEAILSAATLLPSDPVSCIAFGILEQIFDGLIYENRSSRHFHRILNQTQAVHLIVFNTSKPNRNGKLISLDYLVILTNLISILLNCFISSFFQIDAALAIAKIIKSS